MNELRRIVGAIGFWFMGRWLAVIPSLDIP